MALKTAGEPLRPSTMRQLLMGAAVVIAAVAWRDAVVRTTGTDGGPTATACGEWRANYQRACSPRRNNRPCKIVTGLPSAVPKT